MDYKYLVIETDKITASMLASSNNSKLADLRKNFDGTLSLLKYPADDPKPDAFVDYNVYTFAELLSDVFTSVEWTGV